MLQLLLKKQALTVINKKPSIKQGFLFLIFLGLGVLWILLLTALHYHCPILELFHLFCPGCGGTRMVISLLNLDFYQAFRYNPLLFILLIIGFIYLIFMGIVYKKKKILVIPSIRIWISLIVILFIYMILRNLEPFVYLIPTEV